MSMLVAPRSIYILRAMPRKITKLLPEVRQVHTTALETQYATICSNSQENIEKKKPIKMRGIGNPIRHENRQWDIYNYTIQNTKIGSRLTG